MVEGEPRWRHLELLSNVLRNVPYNQQLSRDMVSGDLQAIFEFMTDVIDGPIFDKHKWSSCAGDQMGNLHLECFEWALTTYRAFFTLGLCSGNFSFPLLDRLLWLGRYQSTKPTKTRPFLLKQDAMFRATMQIMIYALNQGCEEAFHLFVADEWLKGLSAFGFPSWARITQSGNCFVVSDQSLREYCIRLIKAYVHGLFHIPNISSRHDLIQHVNDRYSRGATLSSGQRDTLSLGHYADLKSLIQGLDEVCHNAPSTELWLNCGLCECDGTEMRLSDAFRRHACENVDEFANVVAQFKRLGELL